MGLLMPVGGNSIWGNSTWSPEGEGLGQMLRFTKPVTTTTGDVCIPDELNPCDLAKNSINGDASSSSSTSFEKNVSHTFGKDSSACIVSRDITSPREEMNGRDKLMLQQVEKAGISEERRKHVSSLPRRLMLSLQIFFFFFF
jgi:hypothetical protein